MVTEWVQELSIHVNMSDNTKSILAFAVAVLGIVSLLVEKALFAGNMISIGIQILAVLLMIWARKTFGMRSFHAAATPTQGDLVTTGPYRYLRHPIYAAVTYFVWAGVLPQMTVLSFFSAGVVTTGLYVRMMIEERLLKERYPEYTDYMTRTKRFIPFVL